MASQPSTHRLSVPGGELHYEVRGSGPLLLTIAQPMTSSAFAPLADLLAEDHTVVTYDPHGLGQSTVEDPSRDVTPEVQAEDLSRLVAVVGGGPADLLASSGGAVAGLAFATRHPEQVRTLVAHEPPVTELLVDAPHIRAAVDAVEAAYLAHGSGAAWGKFVSLVVYQGLVTAAGVPDVSWPPTGADPGGDQETGPDQQADEAQDQEQRSEKQLADDELFFLRMLKHFTRYLPDVDTLRSGAPRVVVAVGEAGDEELAKRSAVALAERLGTMPVVFPGDHAGFISEPDAFAEQLRKVLAATL